MERLKKVASSASSRVIANLQQAASETFTSQQQQQQQQANSTRRNSPSQYNDMTIDHNHETTRLSLLDQRQDHDADNQYTMVGDGGDAVGQQQSGFIGAGAAHSAAINQPRQEPAPLVDADAGAQLIAAQASAHLTEQERQILLQVFRRQEQFRHETLR